MPTPISELAPVAFFVIGGAPHPPQALSFGSLVKNKKNSYVSI